MCHLRRTPPSGTRSATWLLASVTALACALTFSAPAARATVIYQYTGNYFTDFSLGINPYTTSDYVHGSFTVATALAPSLVAVDIQPLILSFVFNDFADDHAPITSAPPGGFYFVDTPVSTDGSGNIIAWKIGISNGLSTHYISTFGSLNALDDADYNAQAGPSAWNTGSPGVWSIIPEPSAVLLLSSGLAGLAVMGRPRRHGM